MRYTQERIRNYRQHVNTIEKLISIPAKSVVIVLAIIALSPTMHVIDVHRDGEVLVDVQDPIVGELTFLSFSIAAYCAVNVVVWMLLFGWPGSRKSLAATRALLLVGLIADLYFLSMWLTIGGEALENNLFWIYSLLLIRSVMYFPEMIWQITIAVAVIAAYTATYLMSGYDTSSLGFRIIVLILVSLSVWGLYSIYQRRHEIEEELQERTIRSQRLSLAGVVAKETAHSLKNPLAIINNACFLLRRYSENTQDNVKKQIDIITSEVGRADRIITELMSYSNLAEGKIEKTDVNAAIEESLEDLHNEIERRQLVVQKQLAEGLPALMIDETQFKQVVSNILLNACQASANGRSITIRSGLEDDGPIKVEIQDQGKGIAEENLRNIFKAFFTTKETGTGLGLSIVHTIMQAYNGRVDVESQVGNGTTFRLYFPTRTQRIELEE